MNQKSHKLRLDQALVERGLAPSREKAQGLIMAGVVRVNGLVQTKAGKTIPLDALIECTGKDHPYVSRGGVKLEGALKAFGLEPHQFACLDVGASTGGFTHCLLLHGAARVYAVDVGYGQLAWELQQDERVISMERTNFRNLEPQAIGEPIDLIVIDASFISLRLIIPHCRKFLKAEGQVIALVKPQFEAGKHQVGRGGRVRDAEVHLQILDDLQKDANQAGYEVLQWAESQIMGKKSGNQEYFLHLKLSATAMPEISEESSHPLP